jgi:hypothetical protein
LRWYFKDRRHGVPIEFRLNKDYLDWHYNYRPALLKYENIHKDEDCFIIGNGPSLNKMNLSLLNGYHTFGLNKIHLIFEKHLLELSYHVATNPFVVEQIKDQLDNNTFACPSFVTHYSAKKFTYRNKNVHRLFTNPLWFFSKTIAKPINEGYTVTFVAMQIAYYMGFKNVYLIGVDHNFQQTGSPNQEQIFKGDDVNHFHPDYFKGHQWHLADIEGNEASYALAKHQFHETGRQIFDATVDGKLNIFSKIPFTEALKMAKKKFVKMH